MANRTEISQELAICTVVARFDDPNLFEDAVEAVEKAGMDRENSSMPGSREAVEQKFNRR